MSGGRDPAAEFEGQMRAAGALIESLEEEVASLRRDLDGASVALRAAQKEVAARERALEEGDSARARAEDEARALRRELSELRATSSGEQLRLRDEHVRGLASLREEIEAQRRAGADGPDGRLAALEDVSRREREAADERHGAEVGILRREFEEQRAELERSLQEGFDRRLAEERRSAGESRDAALGASGAAAGRELEAQEDYRAVLETRQAEIEALRREIREKALESEEQRKRDVQELKELAERRERDLRRALSARLAEAKGDADRRVAALKAQREADNRALRARHAREMALVRREHGERLTAEEERRRSETVVLEERLAGMRTRRETEARVYGERLRELEAIKVTQREAAERDLDRQLEGFTAEISRLEDRVAGLEEALEESEGLRGKLVGELEAARADAGDGGRPDDEARRAEEAEERLRELDAERILAQQRVEDLEARLREAREEGRRSAEELGRVRESLGRLAGPDRRLRAGIELFNASEHARTVASISKSFGLPMVHAEVEDGPGGKPNLTFVWGDIAWRRYVSDPTEGVEEPRVYLTGAGDETSQVRGPRREPNARMDSRGRLALGIRAR